MLSRRSTLRSPAGFDRNAPTHLIFEAFKESQWRGARETHHARMAFDNDRRSGKKLAHGVAVAFQLRPHDLRIATDLNARIRRDDERTRKERVRQKRHDAERVHVR